MNRLKLDELKIILLKQMFRELFSDYKYFRIRRDGIVIFRESFWKFWTTQKVSIFELCTIDIPRALTNLNKYYHNLFIRSGLHHEINNYTSIVSNMIALNYELDIIKYLWEEFIKVTDPISNTRIFKEVVIKERHPKYADDSNFIIENVRIQKKQNKIIKLFRKPKVIQLILPFRKVDKLILNNKRIKLLRSNKRMTIYYPTKRSKL